MISTKTHRRVQRRLLSWLVVAGTLTAATTAVAQTDPGPRGGGPNAGGALQGLGFDEMQYFRASRDAFNEVVSVSGTIAGEDGIGLGPRFNHNSCAACHAQPAVGGSSPAVNPQVAVATLHGAANAVPGFISAQGPARVARFVRNPDGTPDGSVHDLFVITGRSDAPGCNIAQPDFAGELARNNVALRIPTPLFGLGLIETVPDANLVAAVSAMAPLRASLGIAGQFNRSANDNGISRFGWKAQDKSLVIFSGEAYLVEQGVTNEVFPNERDTDAGCGFNATPEDATRLALTKDVSRGSASAELSSDTVKFAMFMRLLAPPAPAQPTQGSRNGRQVFDAVGCQACHIPTQVTGPSRFAALDKVAFQPFSDFALHDMGSGLGDGVVQGKASGSQFRTAPLWGLGQRLFFLHDGRASDLVAAIQAHASPGSEANKVVANYNALGAQARQDLLVFLRSL